MHARTHARTENIYSIFRDKLLLLGEHGYVESHTEICDLLLVVTDTSYDLLLSRNPYIFKRPKRQRRAFPIAFFHRLLSGSYWLLLKGLG
jgi:hypothetical protein